MPRDAPDYEQPTTFASQQRPMFNGRESAANVGDIDFVRVEATVPANSTVTKTDVQQQVDLPAVQEATVMYSIAPHVENTHVRTKIDENGDGTFDSTPIVTPRTGFAQFAPGLTAPPTVVVDIDLVNNGSTSTTIGSQAVFRNL